MANSDLGFLFVAILMVGVVAGYFWLAQHFNQKRRAMIQAWARQKGLSFSEAVDSSFLDQLSEFDFIRKGNRRQVYNICSGVFKNYKISAFDFTCVYGERLLRNWNGYGRVPIIRPKRFSRRRKHHRYSVVVFDVPFELKPLVIRPERLFDKLIAVFGFDDIDFESKEFSSQFSVKSPDREWAHTVLHDQAIQHLLQLNPTQTIVFAGNRVCVFQVLTSKPLELSRSLEVGAKLLDLLPDAVKSGAQNRAEFDSSR